INRVKEKLLLFARNQLVEQKHTRALSPFAPGIECTWTGTDSDPSNLTPTEIDRTFPQIWRLSRKVEPFYTNFLSEDSDFLGKSGIEEKDDLQVGLWHSRIYIRAGRETTYKLKDYLSEDDINFLINEYAFARRDLAKALKAMANNVELGNG